MENQITLNNLPVRDGSKPKTTNTNPHTQLDQQPEDISFVKELSEWAFALENIEKGPSAISVPGAIAMYMEQEHACKSCSAFMQGTEFAHFHPHPDYSLHLGLPKEDAEAIIEKGWGEWHPLIARGFLPPNIIMLYAPRTQKELEIAKSVLKHSYDFAKGKIEQLSVKDKVREINRIVSTRFAESDKPKTMALFKIELIEQFLTIELKSVT